MTAFFLVFVLSVLIYDLSYYVALRKYAAMPGVAVHYQFVVGIYGLFMSAPPEDRFGALAKVLQKNSGAKLVAFNAPTLRLGKLFLFLLDPQLIKEFSIKENSHMMRDIQADVAPLQNLGFAQHTGDQGTKGRLIYTEFFLWDHIKTLVAPMQEIWDTRFISTLKKLQITDNDFTKINLRRIMEPVFLDWNSMLMFGCQSADELLIDMTGQDVIYKGSYWDKFPKSEKTNLMQLA